MTLDEVAAELTALLERSGCVRLEIIKSSRYFGYCIDGENRGFHVENGTVIKNYGFDD